MWERNIHIHVALVYRGEGVSWHVFQKNAHKTQESLISGMSDIPVKGKHLCYQFKV